MYQTQMSSVVQHGRRRRASKSAPSAEGASRMIQRPDLRQVKVLPKAEWLRIQDELNQVNKETERQREAADRREALHLQSKEAVKLWSNTLAGQRQKKLEAKKIREQIEEEKRKLIDIEEAQYREQTRKEAIEKAKTQLYYQTDQVKRLHRALLLTEVLKEREAQIELKQRIKSASKDVDKEFLHQVKSREDEAQRQDQEKARQKKFERLAIAEELKNKIKENDLARERQKAENKKEGEEIQRLRELYLHEQRTEDERQAEHKRNVMRAHLEHLVNRDVMRAADAQKQEAEEEQRKVFLSAKQKMMRLRREKEAELLREAQVQREKIMNKLIVEKEDKSASEEQRIATAVAEREARQAQQRWEEEEKKMATMKSIATQRELMRQEKEQRDKVAQQTAKATLMAKKEADRIFSEKQQLKAQRVREDKRKLHDFHATQMAMKMARDQQLRREEQEFMGQNTQLMAEEDKQFQQYSRHVISVMADAQRNMYPLCRVAREGVGGGLGPPFSGVRPSYQVQDSSGAPMPRHVSGVTHNIRKLNEAVDIEEAKRRLGFMWC